MEDQEGFVAVAGPDEVDVGDMAYQQVPATTLDSMDDEPGMVRL